jgi:hypothetical protein
MKKIIAAAVATAFVVPAFAADVTLSGDVEYTFTSSDSALSDSVGDQDVTVSASETFADGMTVSAFVELDGGTAADSRLALSNAMGTFQIGDDVGTAVTNYDEKSGGAEAGGLGGVGNVSTDMGMLFQPATGIDGLEVALGFGNNSSDKNVTSYVVQYTMGGFTIATGSTETEDNDNHEGYVGISATFGPINVAYEAFSNYAHTDGDDVDNMHVTYNYGPGTIFIESGERDNGTNTHEETVYGVSYKMNNVNFYVAIEDEKDGIATTATDVNKTHVGVEYAF